MFTFRTSLLSSESDSGSNVNYLKSKCGVSVVTSGLGINTDTRFRPANQSFRTSSAFIPAWIGKYMATYANQENRTSNIYDEISIPVPETTSA
uniref:Uncharacterized protein n=2 Tax=Tetranychus urticae TaxID=32264 RepID=T1KV48_TETUR